MAQTRSEWPGRPNVWTAPTWSSSLSPFLRTQVSPEQLPTLRAGTALCTGRSDAHTGLKSPFRRTVEGAVSPDPLGRPRRVCSLSEKRFLGPLQEKTASRENPGLFTGSPRKGAKGALALGGTWHWDTLGGSFPPWSPGSGKALRAWGVGAQLALRAIRLGSGVL